MENEIARKIIEDLAGRRVCDDCADTFIAILDRITAHRVSDPTTAAQSPKGAVPLVRPRSHQTVPIEPSMLATLRGSLEVRGNFAADAAT